MKTLIASALVAAAAFTGAVNASTAQIKHFAPGADLSVLSDAEINSLLSVVHSGDTESEKRQKIRAALN